MTLDYSSLGLESGFPVMEDPYVADVFAQRDIYQQELDYTPSPDTSRIHEMINDLSRRLPYTCKSIWVTGLVRSLVLEEVDDFEGLSATSLLEPDREEQRERLRPALQDDGDTREVASYFVNEAEFVSHGFAAEMEPWPELVGEHEIGLRAVLKLNFKRIHTVALSDGTTEEWELAATALPKDVIVEGGGMSSEYAELLSHENFQPTLDDIDERLVDTTSLTERLMALKGLKVACADHTSLHELSALEMHVNDLVDLEDADVPFFAEVKKGAALFDPEEEGENLVTWTISKNRYVIMIDYLRIRGRVKTKINQDSFTLIPDLDYFEPRLVIRIITETASTDSNPLEVRLSDIKLLRSIRDLSTPKD